MADFELPPPLTCPLPLYFRRWNDVADTYVTGAEPCKAPLHVHHERSDSLMSDGIYEGGDWWRVECENGHVLVLPESDGDEPPAMENIEIAQILRAVGVHNVHPLLDPPQGPRCTECERTTYESAGTPGAYECTWPRCPKYGKVQAVAKGGSDGTTT